MPPDETTATCWPAFVRLPMSAAIPASQSRRTAPAGSTRSADPILTIRREQAAGGKSVIAPPIAPAARRDRKSVVEGKRVAGPVGPGGRALLQKQHHIDSTIQLSEPDHST